ncbi:hypothetical protein PEC18_39790 [Paucibacter sp. O1-1]|nr:hypothetical protein [Paucibacter sp. O1-1]MDA3831753.1 hypothetical protein [Paucibacter sp. O1-1]
MSITLEQASTTLNELKCRTNFNIKNVTEYMLPELKEPVYLHVEGKVPLLIIRPAFEVFSSELATIGRRARQIRLLPQCTNDTVSDKAIQRLKRNPLRTRIPF